MPVADDGDETLETLVEATGGGIRSATVSSPIGKAVTGEWGALGDGQTAGADTAST